MATKPKVNEKMYSYRDAAKVLGVHYTTIDKQVQRGNIKPSKYLVEVSGISESELRRFQEHTTAFRPNQRKKQQEIVDAYLADGLSMKQVGKKFGVSESWVSYLVKRSGKLARRS